jgi:hypothetical protein
VRISIETSRGLPVSDGVTTMIVNVMKGLGPFFAVAAALTALPPAPAQAESLVCGKREQLADFLSTHFQETRESMGLSKSGTLVEIYRSEAGTWTIVRSAPNGIGCIIDAGDAWTGTHTVKAPFERGT